MTKLLATNQFHMLGLQTRDYVHAQTDFFANTHLLVIENSLVFSPTLVTQLTTGMRQESNMTECISLLLACLRDSKIATSVFVQTYASIVQGTTSLIPEACPTSKRSAFTANAFHVVSAPSNRLGALCPTFPPACCFAVDGIQCIAGGLSSFDTEIMFCTDCGQSLICAQVIRNFADSPASPIDLQVFNDPVSHHTVANQQGVTQMYVYHRENVNFDRLPFVLATERRRITATALGRFVRSTLWEYSKIAADILDVNFHRHDSGYYSFAVLFVAYSQIDARNELTPPWFSHVHCRPVGDGLFRPQLHWIQHFMLAKHLCYLGIFGTSLILSSHRRSAIHIALQKTKRARQLAPSWQTSLGSQVIQFFDGAALSRETDVDVCVTLVSKQVISTYRCPLGSTEGWTTSVKFTVFVDKTLTPFPGSLLPSGFHRADVSYMVAPFLRVTVLIERSNKLQLLADFSRIWAKPQYSFLVCLLPCQQLKLPTHIDLVCSRLCPTQLKNRTVVVFLSPTEASRSARDTLTTKLDQKYDIPPSAVHFLLQPRSDDQFKALFRHYAINRWH